MGRILLSLSTLNARGLANLMLLVSALHTVERRHRRRSRVTIHSLSHICSAERFISHTVLAEIGESLSAIAPAATTATFHTRW